MFINMIITYTYIEIYRELCRSVAGDPLRALRGELHARVAGPAGAAGGGVATFDAEDRPQGGAAIAGEGQGQQVV